MRAQTHECDKVVTSPAIFQAGTYTLGVCWDMRDSLGAMIDVATTTWFVYTNGVRSSLVAPVKSATTNMFGQAFFSWQKILFKTDLPQTFSVEVCIPDPLSTTGAKLCTKDSSTFTITQVRGRGPGSPTGTRIQ